MKTLYNSLKKQVVVTGSSGQLGQELRCLLGDRAAYCVHDDLDITDESVVQRFFSTHNFDFVINCAAYNDVNGAEDDTMRAELVNYFGPLFLAKYARRVIHISTDYVFDGVSSYPYRENDATAPLSVYGRTKIAGERAVLEYADTAVVIRTAWLYSAFGSNFVKTMRRLGSQRESLGVVFDQVGTPTYAADLAAAIVAIVPQIRPGMKEIYHYSNEGVASWYDFAVAVMEMSGLSCAVRPIESAEYPTRAARPAYSVLNKVKIKKDFGLTIPYWREALKRCLEKMDRGE